MSVDGFVEMPSFRPDGRLERLNHGGGTKLPKTIPGEPAKMQKAPDFFRALHLMAYQKSHGLKKTDMEVGYNIPPGMGKKSGGGSGAQSQKVSQAPVNAGVGATKGGNATVQEGMYTQESAPAATSAGAMPKKKRTLLSGGGRSFGQPYGNDTVLGG